MHARRQPERCAFEVCSYESGPATRMIGSSMAFLSHTVAGDYPKSSPIDIYSPPMSAKERKPKKIRRRRTTGRVSGTTQSSFATNSMSSILEQQAKEQARKKAEDEDEISSEDGVSSEEAGRKDDAS